MKKLAIIAIVLVSLATAQAPQMTQLDVAYQYVYTHLRQAKLAADEHEQSKAALDYLYQQAKSWEMYETKLKETADAAAKNTAPVPVAPVESSESSGSK